MTEAGILPNAGLVGIPTRLAALAWYGAFGSGTTPDAITDTTVETEITTDGLARALLTASYEANYKMLLTKTYLASANHTVTKFGVLDAASGGGLYGIHKFSSAHSVLNGNSIVVSARFTFGR